LLTESVSFGSRSPVRPARRQAGGWEKAAIIGVASGQEHPVTRRCKRRRHGSRVSRSNWGGPASFPPGRGISDGVRRKAEGRGDAVSGVGDARSSVEPRDSTTRGERRGISRSAFAVGGGGPA
jgi:hypothetical protein